MRLKNENPFAMALLEYRTGPDSSSADGGANVVSVHATLSLHLLGLFLGRNLSPDWAEFGIAKLQLGNLHFIETRHGLVEAYIRALLQSQSSELVGILKPGSKNLGSGIRITNRWTSPP
jgi:hypothetical protein